MDNKVSDFERFLSGNTFIAHVVNEGELEDLPGNKMDLYMEGRLKFQAFTFVAVLPRIEDADEGVFYVTPDGNFYFVQDGEWALLMESQHGGMGMLTADLPVSNPLGRYTNGQVIPNGTDFETMFRAILQKTSFPTLTNPSATLSYSGSTLNEVGSTVPSATATINFNRGSISPAYGTSGFRVGAASQFVFSTAGVPVTRPTGSTTIPALKTDTTITGQVVYTAGEQPKDSDGNDYGTAMPAGTISTNNINVEFVYAVWANAANNQVIAKQPLQRKSATTIEVSFVNAVAAYPETIDVPTSWKVSKVEVFDTTSNQWKTTGDFATKSTTHNDAAGNTVAYTRYYDSRGVNQGARRVRLTVKQQETHGKN